MLIGRRNPPKRLAGQLSLTPSSWRSKNRLPPKLLTCADPNKRTSSDDDDDTSQKEVPLGEELLHNMSLLLSTYENKVYSTGHFVTSTRRKLEGLQSEVSDLQRQQDENKVRVDKLRRVEQMIDQVEEIFLDTDRGSLGESMMRVQSLLEELGRVFTAQERAELKFAETLIPSLVGDFVREQLDRWDPLVENAEASKQLIESVVSLGSLAGGSDDASVLRRSMVFQYLVPRIQRFF